MLEYALKTMILFVLGAIAIYLSYKEIRDIELEEAERMNLDEFVWMQNVVSIDRVSTKSRKV